jgi:phage gpG-like protein
MIKMDMKKMFFDRAAVISKVDTATRKALSKFGAYVRTSAKRSIKNAPFMAKKERGVERTDFRKAYSKPGQPPYSHSGKLKKFIYFAFDPGRRSVVIGPQRLFVKRKGEAPSLHEYGGSTSMRFQKKRKTVRYSARPYMGPAFNKEQSKLSAIWRDSIK